MLGLTVYDAPQRVVSADPQRRRADLVDGHAAVFVGAAAVDRHLHHPVTAWLGVDRDVTDRLLVLADHPHRESVRRGQLDGRGDVLLDDLEDGRSRGEAVDLREERVGSGVQVGDQPLAALCPPHPVLKPDRRRETHHVHLGRAVALAAPQQLEACLLRRAAVPLLHCHRGCIHRRQRHDHVAVDRLGLCQHPRVLRGAARRDGHFAGREASPFDLACRVGRAEQLREVYRDHRQGGACRDLRARDRVALGVEHLGVELLTEAHVHLADALLLSGAHQHAVAHVGEVALRRHGEHVAPRHHADEPERTVLARARRRDRKVIKDPLHPWRHRHDLDGRAWLPNQHGALRIEALGWEEAGQGAGDVCCADERAG